MRQVSFFCNDSTISRYFIFDQRLNDDFKTTFVTILREITLPIVILFHLAVLEIVDSVLRIVELKENSFQEISQRSAPCSYL